MHVAVTKHMSSKARKVYGPLSIAYARTYTCMQHRLYTNGRSQIRMYTYVNEHVYMFEREQANERMYNDKNRSIQHVYLYAAYRGVRPYTYVDIDIKKTVQRVRKPKMHLFQRASWS